jgi:hypothetical protein
MALFRIFTRDLLWTITLVSLAAAWAADHCRQAARESRVREWLSYVMGASDAELEPLFEPPTREQIVKRRAQKDLISLDALNDRPPEAESP